jgi:hypothetical protein
MRILAAIIVISLFQVACSGSKPDAAKKPKREGMIIENLVTSSHPKRPGWMFETPSDDQTFTYLVGISQKFSDEQGATDNAATDATNRFIKSCGVRVSFFDSYVKSSRDQSTAGPIVQTITGKSVSKQRVNAFVSGLKIKERYTEKYEVLQDDVWLKNAYVIALLFKVPLDECGKIIAWQEKHKTLLVRDLDRLIDDAKGFEAVGNLTAALKTVDEADQRIIEGNVEPADISYQYSTVKTLQKNYKSRLLTRKVEELIREANNLANSGNLIGAFSTLNTAKTAIAEDADFAVPGKSDMTTVELEEKKIAGELDFTAVGRTSQKIEPGSTPEPLTVSLKYKSAGVANIPVLFKVRSAKIEATSNSKGEAFVKLPPTGSEGKLVLIATINLQSLKEKISPEAGKFLAEKQVRFDIVVSAKTSVDKAGDLIQKLADQINQNAAISKPVVLAIGNFKLKDSDCSSPFLEGLRTKVNAKAVNNTSFKVKGLLRIPKNIPDNLDPNIEADQARIMEANILSAVFEIKGENAQLNAVITGADSQLASAAISFDQVDIDKNAIAKGCKETQTVLDKILPLQSPGFHMKVWTDVGGGTYKVGDKIDISAVCSTRCYLKIFNIDENGQVTVLEDSGKKRLIKNKQVSFTVKAVDEGVQSLVAIASKKKFPVNFELNQTFVPNEFPILFRQLRGSSNTMSEAKTAFTIVK